MNDSDKRKKQLDYYIENEIYDELEYLVYEKQGLYPLQFHHKCHQKYHTRISL